MGYKFCRWQFALLKDESSLICHGKYEGFLSKVNCLYSEEEIKKAIEANKQGKTLEGFCDEVFFIKDKLT
ncbi:hypothetical protein BMS3Abin17_01039 [archaeon BMS3Abin17]|nr:hypothetical protein BMS3Abin17_01039 [archaeon BMS3Abin17]HDZ60681.1 hypothetical protein [Candidatus Pacearchaeota archaeon]